MVFQFSRAISIYSAVGICFLGVPCVMQGCEVSVKDANDSGAPSPAPAADKEQIDKHAGPSATDADVGKGIRVVSYNILFSNIPCCVEKLGKTAVEIKGTVMGTQENWDGELVASKTNGVFAVVPNTLSQYGGHGCPILYDSSKVSFEGVSGSFDAPNDHYGTDRAVTYAKFKLGSTVFWHFNTHLPHKSGAAGKQDTHAQIAQMLLEKRRSLGAEDSPTVITGDFNSFASSGDPQGSFEDNVLKGGFTKSYEAAGNTGGYGGLDKIFYSTKHWTSAEGRDGPTGGSDHASIYVDLTLKR